MIGEERLHEVVSYYLEHGDFATIAKFNIKYQSLLRYINLAKQRSHRRPKILFFDIEISPILAYTFSTYKPIISDEQIVKDWYIICWAAKWFDNEEVIYSCVSSEEAQQWDDRRVVAELHKLLSEADVVIGHNAKKFDIKKLNAKALIHSLPPLKPFQIFDTLEAVRKVFGFTKNNLNFLAQIIANDEKIATNFALWKDCVAGKEDALNNMLSYCIHDTLLLEMVYHKIKPYVKSHPNLAILQDAVEPCCTICGSYNIEPESFKFTAAHAYPTYRCTDCGAVSVSRTNATKLIIRQKSLKPNS